MLRTLTAAAVAALVLVLPATGLAMNGPVGGAPGTGIPLPANYLRDAKYSPAPWTATPVQVGAVVKPAASTTRTRQSAPPSACSR